MTIRYGYYWPSSTALGPGKRFCLWVQGCQKRCYRCTSPDLQPMTEGKQIGADALAEIILNTPEIDGITISGGEPMLQAPALSELLERVRSVRPELTVILFSGWLREQMVRPMDRQLLERVDLLIDGEYVDSLNDNIGLRGSSNQQFHFLSDRLMAYEDELRTAQRKREIFMLDDDSILTVGIKNK